MRLMTSGCARRRTIQDWEFVSREIISRAGQGLFVGELTHSSSCIGAQHYVPGTLISCSEYTVLPTVFRYQTNMAANILDTTMSIQPKEGGAGAGETRETVVFRLAEDMLEKLPQDYKPHEVTFYLLLTFALLSSSMSSY